MIKLLEIENKTVKPTEHCYTITWLKVITEKWPEDALKIYAYLFYMACPSEENPYYNLPELDKEDIIIEDLNITFSMEQDEIIEALNKTIKMYETPTYRAYVGIKAMLDRLAKYMEVTPIEHGRDGNMNSMINAAAKFEQIRQSYKGAFTDMKQEQESSVRGGAGLAYDQL